MLRGGSSVEDLTLWPLGVALGVKKARILPTDGGVRAFFDVMNTKLVFISSY